MISIAKILNIAGLVISMAGAMLVYLNTPKVNFQIYLYNESERPEKERKAKAMNRRTKQGMLFIFFGFLLQLIALFF